MDIETKIDWKPSVPHHLRQKLARSNLKPVFGSACCWRR
jgi:hypothetical protein